MGVHAFWKGGWWWSQNVWPLKSMSVAGPSTSVERVPSGQSRVDLQCFASPPFSRSAQHDILNQTL